jgi:hypothetical protein
VRMVADDVVEEQNVNAAMQRFSLGGRWTTLRDIATTAAEAEAQAFMASPKMTESKLLTLSAVQELERVASTTTTGPILPLPAVAKVIARFGERGFGDGLGEIERRIADDLSGQPSQVENLIQTIASVGVAPELDRIATRLQADPAALDAFIVQLEDIARMPSAEAVTELRTFIDSTLEEISP